jgi:hypothetical protein
MTEMAEMLIERAAAVVAMRPTPAHHLFLPHS